MTFPGRGRGFLSRPFEDPRLRPLNPIQTPPPPPMGLGAQNQPRPRVFTRSAQNPAAQAGSGIVRRQANRNQTFNPTGANDQANNHASNPHFERGSHRRPSFRPDLATSTSSAGSSRPSSGPYISYSMLTRMLSKTPDEILGEMLSPNFPLAALLNDERMKSKYEWILHMTTLLERVTTCSDARERIAMILKEVPRTSYLDGVYDAVRGRDSITDELRYDFLQLFLKMSNKFLALTPYSASDLTKIFERIELAFTKTKSETREFLETKAILDEVLERAGELEKRTQRQQPPPPSQDTAKTMKTIQHDIGPPPDDYRQLPIVPDVREILSEQRTYLRENIVNGVYEDPQHYLDVHFRLLREDFVGPLREGIQQYLSGEEGKNFNVRVYQNVRSYGPRLSPRSGIVYDLLLDVQTASRITWANSRRLIFGNLLLLTFDNFQTCAFVTVEDRTYLEKDLIISVRTLDKVNNFDQMQIDLDSIDFSYSLTMIETMTYFEAYRPVLNALQMIAVDETFPLEPFLLKLSNEKVPPDYVTPTTTYDFTPLLVDPKSEVKAGVLTHEVEPAHPPRGRYRGHIQPLITKEFRIEYKGSRTVPQEYKSVPLLDATQWPTSDELHLNPKQREALILALTQKVALIQGPPGTGKTYLGVRITEMLLHNRAVWCPAHEQSTPILMICHTNHALDQFLELVKTRLNLHEGILRVGNRCQNEAIRPFSLANARKSARDNRSIPREIYHQKHTILDRKTETEESLKIHGHRIEQSRTNILSLSTFNDYGIIDQAHLTSLLAPYQGNYVETALFDWLGLGHGYGGGLEEVNDSMDLSEQMNGLTTEENPKEEPTAADGEENLDAAGKEPAADQPNEDADTTQEANAGADQPDNKGADMNEEEEEEQRRRDEIEFEEDYFVASAVMKPQTTMSGAAGTEENAAGGVDEDGWRVVTKKPYKRRQLTRLILQHPTSLTDDAVATLPDDLWQFTAAQRHDLYRYWLLKYQQYCHYSAREARQEYNRTVAALAEYHQEEDYFILKDSVIVAMTTTCAAKYHTVLEKLQSKIVIVEEAAAIFEAHIITALSTRCEHLILIGDHVQLRPNPSVYRLAQKYHIDVSLFERFINNKFPNVRLNIQHRMRPEIARLMKHFYDDLDDHISVTERPGIRAVESCVYFISHTHLETTVTDGSSKRNDFEANYTIQFAQYLIKQGYRPDQITILVMYLGQRQQIARQAKQINLLQGTRIMVTDNYQGEENDIIILSLVRSNTERKIGFLATHNRICVALSRARCGLYVLGNMKLLADVEDMWKKISKSLFANNELGQGLSLSCRQHSKEKFIADTPESFAKRPEGGCDKACDARLKCGHQCDLMCHNYDIEHKDIVCRKKCNIELECGHLCTKRCHTAKPTQHDPCRVMVDKKIVGCGHQIRFQCAQTPTVYDCKQPVLKRLACDHPVQIPCGIASFEPELKRFSCPTPCGATLACTHKCVGTCGRCRTGQLHVPCQEKCGRSLICSHVCKAPCAANCPPCTLPCQTHCVHSKCKKKCGEPCIPCIEPCSYKCKHLECTRLCSEPCNRGPCNQPCEKKLKCGHDCIGICGEPCPPQCRICNRHVVQEIFFGSEDEPDARFVLLPDCKHLIEVTALDRFISDGAVNSDGSTAIRFPECPRCRHQVRRCTRYMPVINQIHNLIEQVKLKISGGQSEEQLKGKVARVKNDYEKMEQQLRGVELELFKRFFSRLLSPDSFPTPDILILMANTLVFIGEIDHLLVDGQKKLSSRKFDDLIQTPLNGMARYILTYNLHRNFAEQQIQDIQHELERIRRLIRIEAVVHCLEQERPARDLKQSEKDSIVTMQQLTKKSGRFTEDDGQIFDRYMKQLEHLDNLPGLGINERERKAIVSALSMGQGHWYVCPKGHPYVITECGGANQESTCPECGEKIGGQNHRILPTNRHFGLMDGSQHAAWSDAANMNIGQPLL